MGFQRVGHDWSTNTHTHTHTTRSHGLRKLHHKSEQRIRSSEFKSRLWCSLCPLGKAFTLCPLFCHFLNEGIVLADFSWASQALTFSELHFSGYNVEGWDQFLSLLNHSFYITFHNKCFISFSTCNSANSSLPRIREGLSYHTKPSNFPTSPGVSQDFLPKIILASNNALELSVISIIVNKKHFLS